jgi:hypothetical protein
MVRPLITGVLSLGRLSLGRPDQLKLSRADRPWEIPLAHSSQSGLCELQRARQNGDFVAR